MSVPAGYKATQVGVIPVDWEVNPLGSLTNLMTNGFVGKAKSHYVETGNGTLYLQGYNVLENDFNLHGVKFVSQDFHNKNQKSCLKSGDLLTVQTGDVGLTTIVLDSLSNSNCHALIISRFIMNKAHSKYVSYCLNSEPGRSRLRLIETGTTMKHLNVGDMLKFEIPVPPNVAEQSAIAEALSDVDAAIGCQEAVIAKMRVLKTATMQALLSGTRRLPGFGDSPHLNRFKQTEAGLIPEDWKVVSLSETAKRITRGASPRPIDSPVWFDEFSSVGWVRISDVTRSGRYLIGTTQRLSEVGIRRSRPVPAGSLIMSICATVGRPIETKIDTCIHDGFVVFDQPTVDQSFLYHTLAVLEPTWAKHGQTGSQMNLNTGLINVCPISLPPTRREQAAIAEVLSDMDEDITENETKLFKLRCLKTGMMQQLLTGMIRLI